MSQLPPLTFQRLRDSVVPEPDFTRRALISILYRAKVPGGWLVVVEQGDGAGGTFLPDPDHTWDGGSLP